jgi:hypothetical protein
MKMQIGLQARGKSSIDLLTWLIETRLCDLIDKGSVKSVMFGRDATYSVIFWVAGEKMSTFTPSWSGKWLTNGT